MASSKSLERNIKSATHLLRGEYLYFCTSKASKLKHRRASSSPSPPPGRASAAPGTASAPRSAPVHTSAYVSIRQQTLRPRLAELLCIRQHTSAYVSIRQQALLPRLAQLLCIRQHTSAYVSIRQQTLLPRLAQLLPRSAPQVSVSVLLYQ